MSDASNGGIVRRWKAGGWHVHVKHDDGSWERHTWKGDDYGYWESLTFADSLICKGYAS